MSNWWLRVRIFKNWYTYLIFFRLSPVDFWLCLVFLLISVTSYKRLSNTKFIQVSIIFLPTIQYSILLDIYTFMNMNILKLSSLMNVWPVISKHHTQNLPKDISNDKVHFITINVPIAMKDFSRDLLSLIISKQRLRFCVKDVMNTQCRNKSAKFQGGC